MGDRQTDSDGVLASEGPKKSSWKRRIAKEWLIFLVSIFVTSAFIMLLYYLDELNGKRRYEKEVELIVQEHLSNWKPELIAPYSFSTAQKISDEGVKGSILVRKYKEMFPEYSNWSVETLRSRLPKIDYFRFPQRPQSMDLEVKLRSSLALSFIFYFTVVLFIRSIIWSIKQVGVKKRICKNHIAPDGHNLSVLPQNCALCNRRKILGVGWHKESTLYFCRRCWPNIDPAIEWFEMRYALLDGCIGDALAQTPPLFTLLGKEQSYVRIEDGEWLTDQVIQHLSLPRGDISFEFTSLDASIAGTVESSRGKYQVKMSKELEDNFRAVSAILIHELMHVYLSSHGIFYKTQEEYEEATDLACVLLGFGIPMINAQRAWKVDRTVLGGGGVQGGTAYHIVGYLSEKQIGYAFAVFLLDRNITLSDLQDKIDPQCWHIVTDGLILESTYRNRLATKRKAVSLIKQQQTQRDVYEFSCPVCFRRLAVPTHTIKRVGLLKAKCPTCHSILHFDGEKIVKFIEAIK